MDLSNWFKKLRKMLGPREESPPVQAPTRPSSRRGPIPPMPKWAKKDKFFQKDSEADEIGEAETPRAEESAGEAMIKRPGAWLKKKLGGLQPGPKLQTIEKTKKVSKKGKQLSDQDIENILEDVLKEGSSEKEEISSPPLQPPLFPGKKGQGQP
jgi:hypothetical protein